MAVLDSRQHNVSDLVRWQYRTVRLISYLRLD